MTFREWINRWRLHEKTSNGIRVRYYRGVWRNVITSITREEDGAG